MSRLRSVVAAEVFVHSRPTIVGVGPEISYDVGGRRHIGRENDLPCGRRGQRRYIGSEVGSA
jgi:hypothetical protein